MRPEPGAAPVGRSGWRRRRTGGRPALRSGLRPGAAGALVVLLLLAPPLLGNGGTVRISGERAGPFLVSVFSEPTPLRTGEIDISVLLQDPGTESPVRDADVTVRAEPLDNAGAPGSYAATRAQATNKLFVAAKFDIDTPGRWRFTVRVEGDAGSGTVSFDAPVRQATLLDRPVLLVLSIVTPLAALFWLAKRAEERRAEEPGGEA